MIKLQSLRIPPVQQLRALDWNWMLGVDTQSYLTEEAVVVQRYEAEQYLQAAEQLYEMYVEAAQFVLDKGLMDELDIPSNLHELIRLSWEDDRNLHLYGRFDLSGGLNGRDIKLIEFNADTATCIPETAVVQWAHLQANQMDETLQCNGLYESLVANFRALKERNPGKPATIVFSAMRGFPEDDSNVGVLGEAASEAGFLVYYRYVDEVTFSPDEGIFVEREQGDYLQFYYWFKLVPWEFIAEDEPDLAETLTQIVRNGKALVLNPAYTLLFQSKGILKVLWELYPYHPLLLEAGSEPLRHKSKYVEKVSFGREGANVRILQGNGQVLSEEPGEYTQYKRIYQDYHEFMQDSQGHHYQAGVFIANDACALGFRRGKQILGNTAQFIGHLIKD
jgi:glutathionylspermidine synthase